MPDDDSPLDRALRKNHLALVHGGPTEPLHIAAAEWPDAGAIPPRPWLYGTWLQTGQVTVLIAPPGVGKTVLAMTIACEIASGRGVLGQHVHHQANVWYMSLEDPRAEAWRRLESIRQRHQWQRDDLTNHLYLHIGRERRICAAAIGDDGATVVFPDRPTIIEEACAAEIGLIVVDPMVASHRVAERSNEEIEEAVTAWADIAETVGCSVLFLHHTRKGATGTLDDGRGATSLIGAVRTALLMRGMDSSEAEELGVPKDQSWQYVRCDDGKSNMAPKAARAWWGKLDMVDIGNATPAYPRGDKVAAMIRWEPPSPARDLTSEDCNAALDRIGAGVGGRLYSATRRGGSGRWAGDVLMEMFEMSEGAAKRLIDAWLRNGVLEEHEYRDPVRRERKVGVIVVDGKRPNGS